MPTPKEQIVMLLKKDPDMQSHVTLDKIDAIVCSVCEPCQKFFTCTFNKQWDECDKFNETIED
jgi:transcription elongation factor Elf1